MGGLPWRRAAVVLILACHSVTAASLIPSAQEIDDQTARLAWAQSLAAQRGQESRALAVLPKLSSEHPAADEALALRADLLLRLQQWAAAERALLELSQRRPGDRAVLIQLGNLAAQQGHAELSRNWFARAAEVGITASERRLWAAQMQGWGDFLRAEAVLSKQLRQQGRSPALLLEWAGLLRGQQRFAEAQETYREILRQAPGHRLAWREGVRTYLLAKDFAGAVTAAEAGLQQWPQDAELLALRAQAWQGLGDTAAALADYQTLVRRGRAEGWLGLGRLATDAEAATAALRRARSAEPLRTEFFLQRRAASAAPVFPSSLPATPSHWSLWAELLAGEGFAAEAVEAYQRALQQDAAYFPAQIGLAAALAAAHRFEEALAALEPLRHTFPDNFKIELTRARILSWAKAYIDSVAAYDDLLRLAPEHPVLLREKARVLAWGKRMREASRTYAQAWREPVDQLLRADGFEASEEISRQLPRRPFALYEYWEQSAGDRSVRQSLDQHRAIYRLQKSAWLENQAKNAAWNRHFLRAERTLQELIAFDPGNQEALFDLAQAQANQGLDTRAVATYQALLAKEPTHQLARLALARQEILYRPSATLSYWWWDEDGADRVADITRQRLQATAAFPWGRQATVQWSLFTWYESPEDFSTTYVAWGPGGQIAATFNPFLSAAASFSYKNYVEPGIPDTFSGSAALTWNLWDVVSLTTGYERSDIIHNVYAIQQGTQADAAQVVAQAFFNRWVEGQASNTLRFYNDGNRGFEGLYTLGVLLLDHPHTVKLTLGGEYRNTAKNSVPLFANGQEVDVRYPYWTPQHYFRGLLFLEWRHDLSRYFFTHAETHYYLLRLRAGYDTDANPSLGGDVEWRWDFAQRWTWNLQGSLDRSPQWNGAGVFSSLTYRF